MGLFSRNDDALRALAGSKFERDLEYVRTQVYDDKRAPLNGGVLIPQSGDVPEWAETYTHRRAEMIGQAQIVSDYADDLPLVDVSGQEDTYRVKMIGVAYQFSLKEQQASDRGIPLSTKRPMAARVAIEEKLNRIQFYGDPSAGLFGWLTFPYIPRFYLSEDFSEANANPYNVLAELNSFFDAAEIRTDTVAKPNTLAVAPAKYFYIAQTPLREGSDTTILQHFMANRPGVSVENTQELRGAGPDGEDLMVAYRRAPENVEHKLVQPFTQLAPQPKNLAVLTNCVAQSGGVVSDFPLEMTIGVFAA